MRTMALFMAIFIASAFVACCDDEDNNTKPIPTEEPSYEDELATFLQTGDIDDIFSYYEVSSPNDVYFKESYLWGEYSTLPDDTLCLYGIRNEHFWIAGYNPITKEKIFDGMTEDKLDTVYQYNEGYGNYTPCRYDGAIPNGKYTNQKGRFCHDKGFIANICLIYPKIGGESDNTYKERYLVLFNYDGVCRFVHDADYAIGCNEIYKGYKESVFMTPGSYLYCYTFEGDSLYKVDSGSGPSTSCKEPEIGLSPPFIIAYDATISTTKSSTYGRYTDLIRVRYGIGTTNRVVWNSLLPMSMFNGVNRTSLVLQEMNGNIWTFYATATTYEGEVTDTILRVNIDTGAFLN